jgi:hypothetical protein
MRLARFLVAALAALALPAAAFDHTYAAWDALLKQHVRYVSDGHASRVDYTGLQRDATRFSAVLDELQKVTRAEFDGWSKPQQEAFLINAYNAFTVKKILTRYPDIRSIRDFGTVFGNPWKDKFFTLFGAPATLDMVEHEMLRKPGVYDEPRIHFAVVCASVGCPMLRDEAFTADKLDAQLEDGIRRFLADRTRNRYDPAKARLEVSKIFDWYGADFEKGNRGYTSVKATLAKYADLLADRPGDRAVVQAQRADVSFLDYDWSLNDAKP